MILRPSTHDLFARAAQGQKTERTPVWMMRQAGRCDPAYRAYRAEHAAPLEVMFRSPEHAAHLSLLPERFGVDAIIFYQDILTPLTPMGADFVFAPGPVLRQPVQTVAELDTLHGYDPAAELPFVAETFARIDAQLAGRLPVLGFAGAPLTLAVFVIEGKSFGDDAARFRAFMAEEPEALHRFLDKATQMTIDYLRYQAGCGVAAVQLFESAAYLLSSEEYATFALPYQQRIFEALRGTVKTINFARGWRDLASLHAAGADILSLPAEIGITGARAQLGPAQVVQGNLDKHRLLSNDWPAIVRAARNVLDEGAHTGHIFNLSHGLLKETPFDNVARLVALVREYRAA